MINAILSSQFIRSNSTEAFSLYEKSKIGDKKEGNIEYNSTEAGYLIKINKINLIQNGKILSKEQATKKLKKYDSAIEDKIIVYSDLHKKGYVVKEGLKFGGDFRVYASGEEHAKWIVSIATHKTKIDWRDFAAKNRVAHSTNKKMLFALIDSEGDVSYYEFAWIKP